MPLSPPSMLHIAQTLPRAWLVSVVWSWWLIPMVLIFGSHSEASCGDGRGVTTLEEEKGRIGGMQADHV